MTTILVGLLLAFALIILGFGDMIRERDKHISMLSESGERNRFKIRELQKEIQKLRKPKRKYKRRLKK